jgi:hypothetical protein
MNLSSNSINKNNSQNFTKICINNKWKSFYVNYWIYIDATVYSFLPSTLITIFNALNIIRLIKERKKSFELQQTVFVNQYSVFKIKNKFTKSELTKVNHQKRRMAIVECNGNKSLPRVVMSHEQKKHHTINTKLSILTILLITISFCILTMPIVILKIINENYIGNTIKHAFNYFYVDTLKSLYKSTVI